MKDLVIGIDNGISGALCAIDLETAKLIDYTRMPVLVHEQPEKVKGKKRKKSRPTDVDVCGVIEWVKRIGDADDSVTVAIEEPLKFARSSQALRSMAVCYGMLKGALVSNGICTLDVQVQIWQSAMLGSFKRGESKLAALNAASNFLPNERWLASPRSHTPHDGIVDAYLIARFCRNLVLT